MIDRPLAPGVAAPPADRAPLISHAGPTGPFLLVDLLLGAVDFRPSKRLVRAGLALGELPADDALQDVRTRLETKDLVRECDGTGFRAFNMGYASTLALVVFLVIMVVTLIQLAVSRYWVHYE